MTTRSAKRTTPQGGTMTKAFQVTAYDDDGEILAWCNQPTRELAERQVETYLKQGAPDAAIEEVTEIPYPARRKDV